MKFILIFLAINYFLLMIGRLYQFDDESLLFMHYSIMLPLICLMGPICTIVFVCSRHHFKWRYANWNTFLYTFTLLWINCIGPLSAYLSFSEPTIRLTENNVHYVINNPPKGQCALIDLIMDYFKQHPFDKNSDEYSAIFYEENIDSPPSGKRPLAHWWDQAMLSEYQKYQDTVNYELASVTFFNKKNDTYFNGLTRFWLYNDYAHTCNEHQSAVNIIDIESDGTQTPSCD